jgi:hypothetical protein
MGCILLSGVTGALLFQPVEKHIRFKEVNETHALITKPINDKSDKSSSFWKRCINTMDLGLLHDSRFVIMIIVLACNYAASMDCSLIFPFFLQVSSLFSLGTHTLALPNIRMSLSASIDYRNQQNWTEIKQPCAYQF